MGLLSRTWGAYQESHRDELWIFTVELRLVKTDQLVQYVHCQTSLPLEFVHHQDCPTQSLGFSLPCSWVSLARVHLTAPAFPGWVHRTVSVDIKGTVERAGYLEASRPAASHLHSSKTNCRGGYIALKPEEKADSHAAAQPPPSNWNVKSLLLWTWAVLHSHTPPTTMTSGCHGWGSTCGWPYWPQSCNLWSVGLNALDRGSWCLTCALLTAVFLMGGSDKFVSVLLILVPLILRRINQGKRRFLTLSVYLMFSCFENTQKYYFWAILKYTPAMKAMQEEVDSKPYFEYIPDNAGS